MEHSFDQQGLISLANWQYQEILPTAEHVLESEELIITQRFSEYIGLLHFRLHIAQNHFTQFYKRSEVMELQYDVFGARSKFLSLGHDYTRLIVLVYFSEEFWGLNMYRKDLIKFFKHPYQKDDFVE